MPVLHADYDFRAVLVPAGKSVIQFWYMPVSIEVGGVVSVLGLLATAGYVVAEKIKHGRK